MDKKCCSKFEHFKNVIALVLAGRGGVGVLVGIFLLRGIGLAAPAPCGTPGGICKPAQIEGPTIPQGEYLGTCFCNCLPKPGRFTQCNLFVAIPKEGVFNCIGHCRYKNSDPYPDMPGGAGFWTLHASSQCGRGQGANGELTVFDTDHRVLDGGCWVTTKGRTLQKPAVLFLEKQVDR